MNIDYFLKQYVGFLMNEQGDSFFENIGLFTGGTTSARIGKLLNFAVSQMGEDECYVEVGVFTGNTLCQAGFNNEKHCIGIDSYSPSEMMQMTGQTPNFVRDRCLQNINCLSRGKTKLIQKDFRNVSLEEIGRKVGVSFIDGKHDYLSVMENFSWLEPKLADHAIIILDDINYIEVSLAVEDWMSGKATNYDMLAYVKPCYGLDLKCMSSTRDRFLNNGICVIRYHKDLTSNTFSYDPTKMDWNLDDIKAGKKGELVSC